MAVSDGNRTFHLHKPPKPVKLQVTLKPLQELLHGVAMFDPE
mgnify:FL=1